MDDEKAIREVVDTWMSASKEGDTDTVLNLMTDDVVFMVPGQKPFGKEAFEAASREMKNMKADGNAEIKEIKVLGEWAYTRSYLHISVSDRDKTTNKSGYVLTILRKESDGKWRVARDANLLTVNK